jgi:hypothetical protein
MRMKDMRNNWRYMSRRRSRRSRYKIKRMKIKINRKILKGKQKYRE